MFAGSASLYNFHLNSPVLKSGARRASKVAPGAAEFLDGERGVSGVEQQRVNAGRDVQGFVERLFAADVYDLHKRDAGKLCAQLRVNVRADAVAELNGVHSAAPLLLDDRGRVLPAR